jgi:hypothetical protein
METNQSFFHQKDYTGQDTIEVSRVFGAGFHLTINA